MSKIDNAGVVKMMSSSDLVDGAMKNLLKTNMSINAQVSVNA